MPSLRILLTTSGLLVCSNLFMTVAWYGHLKHLRDRPVLVAALRERPEDWSALRIVTHAPELDGADALIDYLVAQRKPGAKAKPAKRARPKARR